MGRGDKKSKKGKRWKGSYGVSRSKNSIKGRLKRASSKKVATASGDAAPKAKRTAKKKEA